MAAKHDAKRGLTRNAKELELAAAMVQCFSNGLSLMAAREPDFHPAMIEVLLQHFVPLALNG